MNEFAICFALVWLAVLTYYTVFRKKPDPTIRVGYVDLIEDRPPIFRPMRGTHRATCYDVYATDTVEILPGEQREVPTGIILNLPKGIDCHIHPRSSLRKRSVSVLGTAIIDQDYRGELTALLFNHGGESIVIEQGERFAQLEFTRVLNIVLELDHEIDKTVRGAGGWGSTGK